MMLRHIGLSDYANKIEDATLETIRSKETRTGDLGGKATTTQFTDAIIKNMK